MFSVQLFCILLRFQLLTEILLHVLHLNVQFICCLSYSSILLIEDGFKKVASLHFTLPVFIGSETVRQTNKQSKGANLRISYLINIVKPGQRCEH